MRTFVASILIFLTGVLGVGTAIAQNSSTISVNFHNYFESVARKAGQGARNEVVRQHYIEAALAPLLTNLLIERPNQISAIIAGLSAAAPAIAPHLIRNATTSFPGFAKQMAQAQVITTSQSAPSTVLMLQPFQVTNQDRNLGAGTRGSAVEVASWAVSTIAQNSFELEQILKKALAASPGYEKVIIQSVKSAYPGFARRIDVVTGITSNNDRVTPLSASLERLAIRDTKTQILEVKQSRQSPHPNSKFAVDQHQANGNENGSEISDPAESVNRIIFSFNESMDFFLFRPIAQGYNYVMPERAIIAVRHFFLNLGSPVIFVNDLAQGDFKRAGITLGRFGINSSLGVLGILDPATKFGWERHHADFGQTMHFYGVKAGPYLVLPLIGPASTRGGIGRLVDTLFQPHGYFLTTGQNFSISASQAIVKREELLRPLEELRENSLDYYTALKTAFWQARQIELKKSIVDGMGDGGTDMLFDAAD